MPRARSRRKAKTTTPRSARKRIVVKISQEYTSNGGYQSEEEEELMPPEVPVPTPRRRARVSRVSAAVKNVTTPGRRRGRKVSESSEENSDVPESEEESSDNPASSDEEAGGADTTVEDVESNFSEEVDDAGGDETTRKRTVIPRDRDPVYVQNRVFPPLQLPASSEDLIIPNDLVLQALGVYEILRRFAKSLQLTPFRFEDFCCALMAEENSKLTAEIFSAIIRLIVRDCESSGLWLAPHDEKDSVYLPVACLDTMTWPELVRAYLQSSTEFAAALKIVDQATFPCVPAKDKLELLEIVCSACLRLPGTMRANLTADSTIQHEESCRACQKPGDLICCENCPATYHLECSIPPLKDIPEGEWLCPVCRLNQVAGVTDCESEIQRQNFNLRQEPLGLDRHGRRFAFLERRLFIYEEDESAVWYYSTVPQFEDVLSMLDTEDLEKELCEALADLKEEITLHMESTLKLTKKAAVSRAMYLEQASAVILEENKRRDDEKKKDTEMDAETEEEDVDVVKKEVKKEPPSQEILDQTMAEALSKEDAAEGVATRTRTGVLAQKSYTEVPKPIVKDVSSNQSVAVGDPTSVFDLSKYAGSGFKLGLEGAFRTYRNIFTENSLAQNKAQKAEERDRRRHLAAKFYLSADKATPNTYEFRWHGPTLGVTKTLVTTVKGALLELEKSIHPSFFHPAWLENRPTWLAAVEAADQPDKLALLLITMEASLRPTVLNPAWHETLGCVRWGRYSAPDREESRNQERRRKREEDELVTRSAKKCYVSFVLGVHHQIWKHKGEEFRLSGKGGVFWWSSRYSDELDESPTRGATPLPGPDFQCPELVDISDCFRRGDMTLFPVDENVKPHLDKIWKGIGVAVEEKTEKGNQTLSAAVTESAKSSVEMETSSEVKIDAVKPGDKPMTGSELKANPGGAVLVDLKVSPKPEKSINKLLGLMEFERDEGMLDVYHLSPNDFAGLAVNAGLLEMPGFKYDYKTTPSWEYPHFPRPNIRTAWRFRAYSVRNWGGVVLQLRLLHAGLKWDDMNARPPLGGKKVTQDDVAKVHSEVTQKRSAATTAVGFPRFEYLIKRMVVPIKDGTGRSNQKSTPGREGLRERRIEPSKSSDPYALESWVLEDELELWEIKSFYDRVEHPVEVPKPPPAVSPSPANLANASVGYRAIQRGKTDSYFLEIPGKTVNGRPQYVILPSGYHQAGKLQYSPVRAVENRVSMDDGSQSASGDDASLDTSESTQPTSISLPFVEKNEKWIKEQSERLNKRMAHLRKLMPNRALNVRSAYARRHEDLQFLVFQTMVIHNPELVAALNLPEEPELSPSPLSPVPSPELSVKKRRPRKDPSGSPKKTSPKSTQSVPLTNGTPITITTAVATATTTAADSAGHIDVIPPLRIKKNLLQNDAHKSPEEAVVAVTATKSRAKMISTAPKVHEADIGDRTPKKRGRKSNAQRQQEAEEAVMADRQVERERERVAAEAKAEATAAAVSLPQIPSPLPEANIDQMTKFLTPSPTQKTKKRQNSKTTHVHHGAINSLVSAEKTGLDGGLPKALVHVQSVVGTTPDPQSQSAGKKGSSGKSKARKRSRPDSEATLPLGSSPKKRRSPSKTQDRARVESETDLHCYCRTPYDQDRFYIGCDKCEKWFHGECVNVKENDANIIRKTKWFCPDCLAAAKAPPPAPTVVTAPAHALSVQPSPAPDLSTRPKSNKKKRRISEALTCKEEAASTPLPKLKIKIPPALVETATPTLDTPTSVIGAETKNHPKITLKLNKKLVTNVGEVLGETVEEPKSAASAVSSTPGKVPTVGKEKETNKHVKGAVYCLCQEPAAASSGYRKFIKCDKCSKWYHPRCIGLTAKKADALSTYACPACQKSPAYRDFLFRPLIGDDCQIPQSVVLDIKKNRVAGPFLQPVDPIQAPDYYREIAEPMDFATISSKLQAGSYANVLGFMRDCGLVFDNARTYNREDTIYYRGAEQLEEMFVNRMNKLRLNWKV